MRFDWGRMEGGPRFLARTHRLVPTLYEPALDLKVYGGSELTGIDRFPEEHARPGLGWEVSAVPSYRVWRRVPWKGDTAESEVWFDYFQVWAYGIVRIPVVDGLHVEPALATGGSLGGGSFFPDVWPFLSLGYVHPLRDEKYLVARLETRAWSWKFWESPQLSLSVSYGCRAVTRVGDDERMQGPGGAVDPWKDHNENQSP
jgi:hypothetical protein